MAEELEKTCENCEYENEDMEGTHCRHCIHNAEEHFEPKINHEKEIRAKVIDEFISRLEKHTQENWIDHQEYGITWSDIEQVAEEYKGECCEWKIDGVYLHCQHDTELYISCLEEEKYRYNYCPICGKKIKVVE